VTAPTSLAGAAPSLFPTATPPIILPQHIPLT